MWLIEDPSSGTTNKVTVPVDGIISVTKPDSVTVFPKVNGIVEAVHHVHVKAGDEVYFKLKNTAGEDTSVDFDYNGDTSTLLVPAKISTKSAKRAKASKGNIMTPADTVNLFANPGAGMGGAIGGGLGAGLLGGVLGGALLGGGNGGLLGNRNGNMGYGDNSINLNTENAIAASERLTNARFDALAQAAIESSIERTNAATLLAMSVGNAALGVAMAKGQGEINTQNALLGASTQVLVQKTSGELGVQAEKTAAANLLATQLGQREIIASINDTRYHLTSAIDADGLATRALIIAQNDANLNRMLQTAQNEIIELRGDRRNDQRSHASEVNVTQTVNQMQQQQQQQQQYDRLAGYIANLAQSIRSTNEAINVGTGTLTANPTNTNTQIR